MMDEIYINELAPRPHNSGHYTIEACETSQFEQHIRAVCNWPLGRTELIKASCNGQYIRRTSRRIRSSNSRLNRLENSLIWKKRSER